MSESNIHETQKIIDEINFDSILAYEQIFSTFLYLIELSFPSYLLKKGTIFWRTKWGACNIEAKRIWLNLELAKKPTICLEYIIVHELMHHLLEHNHNDRFVAYMDKFMPKWRIHRNQLNKLPVAHEDWGY